MNYWRCAKLALIISVLLLAWPLSAPSYCTLCFCLTCYFTLTALTRK
jgi:hypothetical protein